MKQTNYLSKINLRFQNRSLLLIDITFNLFFIVFFLPLVNHAFEFCMRLNKQSYITSANITKFLLSPPTLVLLLLSIFVVLLYFFSKLASLIWYCNSIKYYKRFYPFQIISFGIRKTLHTLRKRDIALIFSLIPYYIVSNLPLLVGVILLTDIAFIHDNRIELFVKGGIILILLVIGILSLRSVFAVHFCINENQRFLEGLQRSKSLLKGRYRKTLRIFLVSNFFLILGFFLFYYLLLMITAISVYLFANKALVITVFLSAYPKISFYATFCFSMIAFIVNVNQTASLFHSYHEASSQEKARNDTIKILPISYRSKKKLYVTNGLITFFILVGLFNFYQIVHNDALSLSQALSGVQISSHRGNSFVAPENTLPALENAIVANSDYAEIDVQQTKDGTLVLMHDNNLLRTAGIDQNVYDLTQAEINELDVGSWFGIEFSNTKIPTLEDALIYCKGKIKLNIEVKISEKNQALAEQLVDLIEQYDYEDQCIISSTNYKTLIKIKKLNEDIKIGHILFSVYGNVYDKEYLDFYSIRYKYITQKVVDSIHRTGKEVHAWTVNSPREIERMKSMGVDCIITDNPALASEIIYRDDTNDTFIDILKKIMKNRSVYRVTHL